LKLAIAGGDFELPETFRRQRECSLQSNRSHVDEWLQRGVFDWNICSRAEGGDGAGKPAVYHSLVLYVFVELFDFRSEAEHGVEIISEDLRNSPGRVSECPLYLWRDREIHRREFGA
jgi:hypothetical protein